MKHPAIVCAVLLPLLFSGCAAYRLGSMLPADVKTVYVPTVINETSEPLIEQDVTRAVLSQVQMDGSLRLADESLADTILEVHITRFWLDPVAYVKGESSTANQYRMSIRASFVLTRRADNSIVAEAPAVNGWYDFDFAGDMTSSKAIALRPAAEDLGRRIVDRIVQYW
ncbi:MAG: LPS assembly lipoprotein LptE [Verrucomicrobiota bacterium]|nr:LPS assembly lipoprotein LptE [Verrucomicrobiota bacterium]